MRRSWHYSLGMLLAYVCLFLVWMVFPSRVLFLLSGATVVTWLIWGFRHNSATGYFANRVDERLHMLVILDVMLETVSFEVFRLFQPLAVVESFHQNTNFVGCATAFTLLIGCYRYFAAPSSTGVVVPAAIVSQAEPR